MGENVIFVKPVDKVGVIHDILTSCKHTNFPVVDVDDNGVLYGTIGRNALCILLQQRAFGVPTSSESGGSISSNYLKVGEERYYPLVNWDVLEKTENFPKAQFLRLNGEERGCFMDLRPYANTAPLTIQESSSVSVSEPRVETLSCLPGLDRFRERETHGHHIFFFFFCFVFPPNTQRTYQLFRSLGLRFLPVVNRHNQVVGTITRSDLTPEALADTMLRRGKKRP